MQSLDCDISPSIRIIGKLQWYYNIWWFRKAMEKIFSVPGYHPFWILRSNTLCACFLVPKRTLINKTTPSTYRYQAWEGGRLMISKARMMVNLC